MTFLGLEARTDLPKVSYPTALDFFVFLSFAFIFATILQFAIVHYFTKYGSGEFYFNFHEESSSDDEDTFVNSSHLSSLSQIETVDIIPLSSFELSDDERESSTKVSKSLRKFIAKYLFCMAPRRKEKAGERFRKQIETEVSSVTQNILPCKNRNYNSVSKIDKFSRFFFPFLFMIINLIYWIFYLTRSQRK